MNPIAVAICTFNPKKEVLERTLEALRAQTLSSERWDLLIVDNKSTPPLAVDLCSWHPNARVVREEVAGLTPARLRAFQELPHDLILFVDDDNVLDPDYLESVLSIAAAHPSLGAFGGRATPVYEVEPEDALRARADFAALKRNVPRAVWGNTFSPEFCPFGAGMVVRRQVGQHYLERLKGNSTLGALDRCGDLNLFCGDCDLAWCAIDIGLGLGVFPQLHFQHLTPAKRVSKDYLLSVAEGSSYSWLLLHRIRGLPHPALQKDTSMLGRLRSWQHGRHRSPLEKEFFAVEQRGIERALSEKI